MKRIDKPDTKRALVLNNFTEIEFKFMRWIDFRALADLSITKDFPALPYALFCRPAEVVAPELIGCRLAKRQAGGSQGYKKLR